MFDIGDDFDERFVDRRDTGSGGFNLVGSSKSDMSDEDKRLNIVRSRASRSLYSSGSGVDTYTSDRGPIAYMKLLTENQDEFYKNIDGSNVDIKAELDQLIGSGYKKFFLTSSSVQYDEKLQILTTFGDNEVVYYFGKQPIVFNLSGFAFDSMESDWFSKLVALYQRVLRGTVLAKNFSLVELVLPNMRLIGSISSLSNQQVSSRDTDIYFNMQFVAKEVEPLPIQIPDGEIQNLRGSLLTFKNRDNSQSGWGAVLGSGTLGRGFVETRGIFGGDLIKMGNDFGKTLQGFRTSMFSPIFGVISSITKIVKNVTGSISKIISSFTNPINQILRDITSIATMATSLALLVENSFEDVISIPARTITNYNNTIRSLKNTGGTISRVPENLADIFKRKFSSGKVKKGAAILSSGKKRQKSKSAVLNTGSPYTPQKSNVI